QVALAMLGEQGAGLVQLRLPGVELAVALPRLEQGIALLQGPGVAPPKRQEARLHVNQPPVHETAARLRGPHHKGVAAGLEGDHGQRGAQIADLGQRLSVQTTLPGLACMAQARLPHAPTGLLPFDEHLDGSRARPHQAIPDPTAETASVGHQMQGLQHAALAAAVGAQQKVETRARRERAAFEAAQASEVQTGYPHGAAWRRAKAERPDQAGRSCSTWNRWGRVLAVTA